MVPALKPFIHVSRQEVYYFDCTKAYYDLPIWVEFRAGDQMYYGIPDHFDAGFKFAYDERQWALDPDRDERGVTPEILAKMMGILTNRFPSLRKPQLLKHHTCVYENALDGDFIVDQMSGGKVTYLAGSSGHGFKMGPAIGQMMLNHLRSAQPLPSQWGIARFTKGAQRKSQYQVG